MVVNCFLNSWLYGSHVFTNHCLKCNDGKYLKKILKCGFFIFIGDRFQAMDKFFVSHSVPSILCTRVRMVLPQKI